ncbi:MAG: hypothetical protein KKG60_00625 [Nanoarchaeota archaeon]|nr:hypothetical protein [Nanoarchaeota archaeon]
MKTKLKFPHCKSKDIIKWSKRKTENRGKIQGYKCNSCSETFVIDPFFRMRNAPEKESNKVKK